MSLRTLGKGVLPVSSLLGGCKGAQPYFCMQIPLPVLFLYANSFPFPGWGPNYGAAVFPIHTVTREIFLSFVPQSCCRDKPLHFTLKPCFMGHPVPRVTRPCQQEGACSQGGKEFSLLEDMLSPFLFLTGSFEVWKSWLLESVLIPVSAAWASLAPVARNGPAECHIGGHHEDSRMPGCLS